MNVLQVPIIDDFWVAPQDPEAHSRTQDFAIEMGFGASNISTVLCSIDHSGHGFASMDASKEIAAR